jgi:hypothetical protein
MALTIDTSAPFGGKLVSVAVQKPSNPALGNSRFATALTKFATISRVGGKPRLMNLSMCCISSDSCCGLSSC